MMDQIKSINALSRNTVNEKELKSLSWYVLFIETGREFSVRDEWIKIKNETSKELSKVLKNIEVVWTPMLEEDIDSKIIVTPYLACYYFVGMSSPMTLTEYSAFKEMSGVIKVINSVMSNNKKRKSKSHHPEIAPVEFNEMVSMFNLPFNNKTSSYNNFSIGSPIRIISGALQNYSGRIKEIRGKRAFIEAGILKNFSTDIEININCLELAEA